MGEGGAPAVDAAAPPAGPAGGAAGAPAGPERTAANLGGAVVDGGGAEGLTLDGLVLEASSGAGPAERPRVAREAGETGPSASQDAGEGG